MIHSTAIPDVSAVITTVGKNGGTPTTTTVKKGDTITGVTLDKGGVDVTIATAVVKGFIGKPLTVQHGDNTSYDGIPTYNYDPEGDSHFGVIEEKIAIDRVVVEIPAESEGGNPTVATIRVSTIKALTVKPATDEIGNSSPSTPKEPGGSDDIVSE